MTGQKPDIFKFNDDEFDLVGIDGPDLFDPNREGFEPQMASTACWRGFQLIFKADNEGFYLDEMSIRQERPVEFKGRKPIQGEWRFSHRYVNMKYKLPFTGRLLIAKDFIQSMYVHMGFQKPIAYRTVIELEIKKGDVVKVIDHSKYYKELRKKDRDKDITPKSSKDEQIRDFIEESFSRRYEIDK